MAAYKFQAPPNGTGNAQGQLLFSEAESIDAASAMAHFIHNHPLEYARLAAAYNCPAANTLDEQVAQAAFLASRHPEFPARFAREVALVKDFKFGNVFLALASGNPELISQRIVRAAQAAAQAPQVRNAAGPTTASPTFYQLNKNLIWGGTVFLVFITVGVIVYLATRPKGAAALNP